MKIAKTASLPYKVIKGSLKTRHKNCRAITEEIFDKIIANPADLSLNRLQQITQDTLSTIANDGRQIDIKIKELKELGYGALEKSIFRDDIATGFEIHIPTKNGQLEIKSLAKFMHEVSHVVQDLFIPKQIARSEIVNAPQKVYERACKFYYNTLYEYQDFEHFSPLLTRLKQKFYLRNIDDKEKINILQEMRYMLKGEIFAYCEEEKYHCRSSNLGIKTFPPPDFDSIMIPEKIEYLEKEIAKLIKKIRKEK